MKLDLNDPVGILAEMVKSTLTPFQLVPYHDPEYGYVVPLDTPDIRHNVIRFLDALRGAAADALSGKAIQVHDSAAYCARCPY